MKPEEQEFNDLVQKLYDAGFDNGWAIRDGVLVLWEHDEDPPAPLTRPIVEKPVKTAK
jgi:hypothetical protein